MTRFLGIDFSGNHLMWRARCRVSNVWIAEITFPRGRATLTRLIRVQQLGGIGSPFDRLVVNLRSGSFDAAGIDAPFSVPEAFIPLGGHTGLLQQVVGMPQIPGRAFADGDTFVRHLRDSVTTATAPKPLRVTEKHWSRRGLAVRSTLWTGARPGAPMTSACLTLLHHARRPMWPWNAATRPGLLVEAFPMAQLFEWRLAFRGYNGEDNFTVRRTILAGIQGYIDASRFIGILLANADALDAVLAGFAAIAVKSGCLASAPGVCASTEGWIAVHRKVTRHVLLS